MSNNSEDIRNIITSRVRKKVPPRDSSLSGFESKKNVSENLPLNDKGSLKMELDDLPSLGKRLAVNLEENIREIVLDICNESEITPDTLFEAAVVMLKDRPEDLQQVLEDARNRLARRKRAGVIRRTLTMMEKYA